MFGPNVVIPGSSIFINGVEPENMVVLRISADVESLIPRLLSCTLQVIVKYRFPFLEAARGYCRGNYQGYWVIFVLFLNLVSRFLVIDSVYDTQKIRFERGTPH